MLVRGYKKKEKKRKHIFWIGSWREKKKENFDLKKENLLGEKKRVNIGKRGKDTSKSIPENITLNSCVVSFISHVH